MYFKQILDERCGCASYMVASRSSHEAAIVDPSIDTEQYETLLEERGFRRGEVRFPTPHSHLYHPEYDAYEAALLNHWDWGRTPLRPDDE